VEKTGETILMIYTPYDEFSCKVLPFGGCNYCTCVTLFSGINFL